MCGRFTTLNQQDFAHVVDVVAQVLGQPVTGLRDADAADFAQRQTVTPGAVAPVLVHAGPWAQEQGTCCGSGCGKCPWTRNPLALKALPLTWGFVVDWQKQRVFNTRIEHAGDPSSMWAGSLGSRHCVVPVGTFFEPHRNETIASARTGNQVKRQYAFGPEADGAFPWLLLAGVFSNGCFSVVTTAPNAAMEPIHDRMPLVLEPHEVATWLGPDYACLADRSHVRLNAEPEVAGVSSIQQLSLF